MSCKPDGYTSASSCPIVRDAEATPGFLETVFRAIRLRMIRCEDKPGIMHPEAHVPVYVAAVQAVCDRAIKAGGPGVQPLTDRGDGDPRGGDGDPRGGDGTRWRFARQME